MLLIFELVLKQQNNLKLIYWRLIRYSQINCRYLCKSWKIGMEINHDVKREEITELVMEMMEGEKGKEMRQKCLEWKNKSTKTIDLGGSSYNNFLDLIKEVIHHNAI